MDKPAAITENVDKSRHPHAADLEAEVVFMADQLRSMRELITNKKMLPVIPYDNGGGQKGIRKNPVFETYSQLANTFLRYMEALDDVLADAPPTTTAAVMSLSDLHVMVNSSRKAASE